MKKKKNHILYKCLSKCIPAQSRKFLRNYISMENYDVARWKLANPFTEDAGQSFSESKYCFGIVEDPMQYHKHYISACIDMKVSYKVLSILDSDWIEKFTISGCDAYLIWPAVMPSTAKATFDYRLYILEKELEKVIYPSWKECWLTEHKPRLRDWMLANQIPHPQTWVFHTKDCAEEFSNHAEYPVVVKTATGAAASGVSIVNSKRQMLKIINQSFGRGLRPSSFPLHDRQRGFIYIQKFLPGAKEWRMVKVGESYFGYRKEAGLNGINSGSKAWSWLKPSVELLDLTKKVCDIGGFTSMDVDVFITQEGKLLVNECQTVFGCTTPAVQMKVNDKPCRYLHQNGKWVLEEGDFCANHMCNMRLEYLINKFSENEYGF
jgi:hypothetical protein